MAVAMPDVFCLRWTGVTIDTTGTVPLAKLQWSHLAQYLAELAIDLLGPAGLLARGGEDAVDGGTWTRLYSFQRYTSIGAGATEVQKNIIADRAIMTRK